MFALTPDLTKARKAKSNIFNLINRNVNTECGVKKIADIESTPKLQRPDLVATHEKREEKKPFAIGVRFAKIHFAYPTCSNVPVLQGLDIAVAPGQFGALVGPSGQSKSTIFNLIERFYLPTQGSIIIDHTNITFEISTAFPNLISLVPQSSVFCFMAHWRSISVWAHIATKQQLNLRLKMRVD